MQEPSILATSRKILRPSYRKPRFLPKPAFHSQDHTRSAQIRRRQREGVSHLGTPSRKAQFGSRPSHQGYCRTDCYISAICAWESWYVTQPAGSSSTASAWHCVQYSVDARCAL